MMLIATPAYGRVYREPSQALMDWEKGKDFFCGKYFNRDQVAVLKAAGYTGIRIVCARYGNEWKLEIEI